MSETHKAQVNERTPEQLLTDGFFPLLTLASKYGYAKDHIGRLARTGRVQAIRCGNKGEWFVHEESLEKYHREMVHERFAPPAATDSKTDKLPGPAHVEDVELPTAPAVLSNDEGSLNAEPRDVHSSPRGQYAILTLAIVLGGILFSLNFIPISRNESQAIDQNANIFEVVGRPFAILWDWLFNTIDEPENYLVLGGPRTTPSPTTTPTPIPTPEFSPTPFPSLTPTPSATPVSSPKPSVIITQGASKAEVDALKSQLNDNQARLNLFENTLLSLQNQITGISTLTFDSSSLDTRISNNAAGISAALLSINTYNDAFTTEVLTVSESTTLAALAVSGNSAFDTNTLFVDALNNRVGIGTNSPGTTFEVIGIASISENLIVGGNVIINGNSITGPELSVTGSGSFTGRLTLNNSPTVAHTGTWPNFAGLENSTLFLNPSSPIADGNIIAYANGNDSKFVVDTEGDVFARNLMLTGSTTQGTTTIAGDLNIEGNSRFGDAPSDAILIVGTVLPHTLTSNIFTIQASPSWTGDYYTRWLDAAGSPIAVIASTGNIGIGTNSPTTKLDVIGAASISTNFEVRGTSGVTASISNLFSVNATGEIVTIGNNTAAQALLDLRRQSTGLNGAIRLFTTGSQNWLLGAAADGTNHFRFQDAGNNVVTIEDDGVANTLYLTNGGNVGIGTMNVDAKLEVAGTASVSGTAYFGGNVGIGTTAPAAKLDVYGASGTLSITAASGESDTAASRIARLVDPSTVNKQGELEILGTNLTHNNSIVLLSGKTGDASLHLGARDNGGNFKVIQTITAGTSAQDHVGFGVTDTRVHVNNLPFVMIAKSGSTLGSNMQLGILSDTNTDGYLSQIGFGWVREDTYNIQPAIIAGVQSGGDGIHADLAFYTRSLTDTTAAPTERMRILANGNVGIGTTGPSELLSVVGTATTAAGIRQYSANTTGSTLRLLKARGTPSSPSAACGGDCSASGDTLGSVDFMGYDGSADAVGARILAIAPPDGNGVWSSGGRSSRLSFYTVPTNSTTLTERLRIEQGGNINLYQVGSSVLFQAGLTSFTDQDIAITSGRDIRVGSPNGTIFIATSTGSDFVSFDSSDQSVGIGTTNPQYKLEVADAGSSRFRVSGDASTVTIGAQSNHNLGIITNGSNRIFIENTGNVGIGTTNPIYPFHVKTAVTGGYVARIESTGVDGDSVLSLGVGNGFANSYVLRLFDSTSPIFGVAGNGTISGVGPLTVSSPWKMNTSQDADTYMLIRNDNAGTSARSVLSLYVDSTTASDPVIGFGLGGGSSWVMGVDNSDSDKFKISGTTLTGIPGPGDLGTSVRFTIDTTGNVGIGTTGPLTTLDVRGNVTLLTGSYIRPTIDSATALKVANESGTAFVTFDTTNRRLISNAVLIGNNSSSGPLVVTTAGEEYFTVDANGSTGVGPGAISNGALFNVKTLCCSGSAITIASIYNTRNTDDANGLNINIARNTSGAYALDVQGAGTSLFRVRGDGNVGIGTTSPTALTHIVGNTSTLFNVASGSNSRFIVLENGNVGIGTTGPTALTSLYSIATASFDITSQGQTDKRFTIRSNYQGSGTSERLSILNGSGTELFTIASSGNVGIGTTVPTSLLEVAGAYPVDTGGSSGKWVVRLRDTTAAAANVGASILFQGHKSSSGSAGNFAGIAGLKENATDQNEQGYLALFTTPSSGVITERMRIDSGGNVGIGTTNPGVPLHVYATTGHMLVQSSTGTNAAYYRAQNTGGVTYIGTENSAGNALITTGGLAYAGVIVAPGTTSGLQMATNGTARMTIDSAGNVGIGTTGPTQGLLQLNKDSTYSSEQTAGLAILSASADSELLLGADAANDITFIQSAQQGTSFTTRPLAINAMGGNVGIGTTNVDTKFEVAGGIASISFTTQDGTVLQLTDSDGSCTHNPEAGSEVVACSSDARLKSDIQDGSPQLDYLTGIPIRDFTVIASGERKTGVIAQELLTAAYEDLVSSGSDGYYKVAEVSSWKVIKGIQELNARVSSLSLTVDELLAKEASASARIQVESVSFSSFITDATQWLQDTLASGSIQLVKAVEGIFTSIKTDRLEVKEGITIYDKLTGEPVCVISEGNVLKSLPGPCATATPTPTPTPTPATGGTSGGEPSPAPTPSADESPPPGTELETSPSPEPSPAPQPSASPTPAPSQTPTPEPEATPQATASPTPEPSVSPTPESTPESTPSSTPEPPPSPDATPAP